MAQGHHCTFVKLTMSFLFASFSAMGAPVVKQMSCTAHLSAQQCACLYPNILSEATLNLLLSMKWAQNLSFCATIPCNSTGYGVDGGGEDVILFLVKLTH